MGDQFASTVLYIHTNQSCKKDFLKQIKYVTKFEQKNKKFKINQQLQYT